MTALKTYLDLVAEARPHVCLVTLSDVDQALAQAEVLIDVREESEFAAGHLPGAVHMSRGTIEARLASVPALQRPDVRILLYCRTDARAALTARSLQWMGYTRVSVVEGGYAAWTQAGREVTTR